MFSIVAAVVTQTNNI